jgi:hypothetical protein
MKHRKNYKEKDWDLGEEYSKKMSFEMKVLIVVAVILWVGLLAILIFGVPKELVL